MSDGVIVLDAQNRIVDINPAAQRIIDCPASKAIGQPATQVFSGRPDLVEHCHDVTEAQTEIALNQDKVQREFDLRISPLYDARGHLTGRLMVLHDITERVRTEEALRESEERFRRLSSAAFEGIAIHDKGKILDANSKIAEMFGYKRSEFIGKYALDLAAPESWDLVLKHIQSGYEKAYEATGLRKDGTTFAGEVVGRPIPYQGRVVRVTAIRDITERKRAEEQIQASLKEKEMLLKEIRHRVKNNLQIIASLLDLQSESLTDPQDLQIFQESQHRIRSMALIHEHLYQSEDLAQIDFAQYIQELVYSLFSSYAAGVSGITLKLDVDAILLDIDTAIPCGLILNELVSNSLKHAFPDGRRGEICIGLRLDHERQTLLVRDNGVGLPENLNFQNTESLGLQLVCTLTDQLKGTITLDRSGGTTFKIAFAELKYQERI